MNSISKRATLEDRVNQKVKSLWDKVRFYIAKDNNVHFITTGGFEFTNPQTFIPVSQLLQKGVGRDDIEKYFSTGGSKLRLYNDEKVKSLYWPMYNRVISKMLRKKWEPQVPQKPSTKDIKEQMEIYSASKKTNNSIAKKMLGEGLGLHGAPYRWGKQSLKEGFDCSGFVYHILNKAGLEVPRTDAATMADTLGTSIKSGRLRVGDLLFWKTPTKEDPKPSKINHTGVYIGNGRFMHSSKGTGKVHVSSIMNSYYKKYFVKAKRLNELSNKAPGGIALR